MFTVTKTADDDNYQVYEFPALLSGTVYIRVKDTLPGPNIHKHIDKLHVDHMFIQAEVDVTGPEISAVRTDIVSDHAWVNLGPAVVSGPLVGRQRFAMAYDSTENLTIMFGGNPAVGPYLNDTWAYSYDDNTWTNNDPNVVGGPLQGRYSHAMAYAPSVGRTVLFGGYHRYNGTGYYLNDTWEYNYSENTWSLAVNGTPAARRFIQMVYDASADQVILFGGTGQGGQKFDETWAYDPNNATWENRQPSGTPGPRWVYAMAYHALENKTILFGGLTPDGESNETWVYDYNTNTWTNMSPTVEGGVLTPRVAASMVYDSSADDVIMFGGEDSSGQLDETWAYNYSTNKWSRLDPDQVGGVLRPREGHAMVYDASAGKTILFGGWTGTQPSTHFGDAWEYMRDGRAAAITWVTDEDSDSVVYYGPTQSLGFTASEAEFVKNHLVSLRNLEANTTYYYQVNSTDRLGNSATDPEVHSFSTVLPFNESPEPPSNPIPADGTTHLGLDVNLSVYVSDPEGDPMDVSFYDESGGLIGTVEAVPNGTRANISWAGLTSNTTYGWYAIAEDDSGGSTQSGTWNFTITTATPGAMYVWDISWSRRRGGGPNAFLTHIVTVRYDSNENGIPEETDLLVDNAIVYSTLNGPGGYWELSGVTVNGVVEFKVKVLVTLHGTYEAHITNITHGVEYAPEMDVDNPDTYYWS